MDDALSAFFSCTGWLFILFDLAIGVVALVRLRATASGILIGGGFIVSALVAMVSKLARLGMTSGLENGSVDFYDYTNLSAFLSTGTSCTVSVVFLFVAIGFFLLPKSLEKLAAS